MGFITISKIKNFLIKIEKKLVDKISYPPGISPQSAWFHYKVIHILLTLFAIAFLPVIGVPAMLIQKFDFTSLEFLIPALMIVFFLIGVYLMSELSHFKCPRCSQRFESRNLRDLNLPNRVCGHCGLQKWKDPDIGKTVHQPGPANTLGRKLNIGRLIRIVLRVAAVLWIIFIILIYHFQYY